MDRLRACPIANALGNYSNSMDFDFTKWGGREVLTFKSRSWNSYPEVKFDGYTYYLRKAGAEWWLVRTRDPLRRAIQSDDPTTAIAEANRLLETEFGVSNVEFSPALFSSGLWSACIAGVGRAYVSTCEKRLLSVSFNDEFVMGPYESFYKLRDDATRWINDQADKNWEAS